MSGPFHQLSRVHAFLVSGDTLVSLALAGSLFFQIDPSSARWRVALYLLITIAPFAVVAPLIGPWMDRLAGGRRLMLMISAGGRALVAFLMIRDLDSFLLFPEAFAMLVLGKAYAVAKSAMVPTVVDNPRALVQANSKLTLISAVAGFAAGASGLLVLKFFGSEGVLMMAIVAFIAGALMARMLPVTAVADQPADAEERAELGSEGIRLGRQAMGLLRGMVGFLAFLLAFALRGGDTEPGLGATLGDSVREGLGATVLESSDPPAWHLGVVLVASAIGSFVASLVSPTLRNALREERILQVVLGLAGTAAIGSALVGGLTGASMIAFAIGFAATAGKQAFDALVQRDAPAANYGRSFASFESRFQILWAIGAFLPVTITVPAKIGYVLVALAAFAGLALYLLGERGILLPDINWPSLGGRDDRNERKGRNNRAKSPPPLWSDAGTDPAGDRTDRVGRPREEPSRQEAYAGAPVPSPTPGSAPAATPTGVAPGPSHQHSAPPPAPPRPARRPRQPSWVSPEPDATRPVPRPDPGRRTAPVPPPPPPSMAPPPPASSMPRRFPPSRAIGPDDPTEPVPEVQPEQG